MNGFNVPNSVFQVVLLYHAVNKKQVDNPSNTKELAGEEVNNPTCNFSKVKSVGWKDSKKEP